MSAREDFQSLNLPTDTTLKSLKKQYDQLNEFLDPTLVENAALREIVSSAQTEVEGAYSRLKKLLDVPPVASENIPKKSKAKTTKPASTSTAEKPESKIVEPPKTTYEPEKIEPEQPTSTSFAEEIKIRLANLTKGEFFTEPWWDANRATVNGLILLLLTLMVAGSIVISGLGG